MADILISGAVKPTTTDTPTDARTRVQTFADIENIENPAIGMLVYVIDDDDYYVVTKLLPKTVAGIEIANAKIDMENGLHSITERINKVAAQVASRLVSKQGGYDPVTGILSFDDEPDIEEETEEETNTEDERIGSNTEETL